VVNPGWGDSVQANKAGLMEIADIFVINKADRKGLADTRRDLEQMLELSNLAADAWRPPILPMVATTGEGVADCWQAVVDHRAAIEASGELARRRQFRVGEELREIVARRLEQRARQLATGDRWEQLQLEVADHRLDPWTAADEMLDGIGG
jgi:LAO/AO transport system kinase